MGMAASQARYLALVARKSNCEYEGQQINQTRLVLSNQTADLFNQMLALEIPSPPSKTDYTYTQYSYKIGDKTYTIDKWDQLDTANSGGYNYAVTYHYNSKEYKGYQRYKTNPQVQFSGSVPTSSTSYSEQIAKIQSALKSIESCQEAFDKASDEYKTLMSQASNLTYYRDSSFNNITKNNVDYDPDTGRYTITRDSSTGDSMRYYIPYSELTGEDKIAVDEAISTLIEYGALAKDFNINTAYYAYNPMNPGGLKSIAFSYDLENAKSGSSSIVYAYYPTYNGTGEDIKGIAQVKEEVEAARTKMETCENALEVAKAAFEALDIPNYVGNLPLTPLGTLEDYQVAAINQILTDMKEEGIETNLTKCFETIDGTYNADTYIGGIYTFDMGGTTVYTTYYDLANSIINGTGINNIDDQSKLPYYGAENMDVPKTATEKALVETDESGRFISIRFENDSVVYTLHAETATDEIAYDDAMNEYNYEKSLYDKRIQDINAQTSLIHRQDQNLELRLKQLDTEQNALNTEIDAVAKVVKDNIEKSFKTFGG